MGATCAGEEASATTKANVEPVKEELVVAKAQEDPTEEEEPKKEEAPVPKVTIKVVGARGLRRSDWIPGAGTSDCYCLVKIAGKEGAEDLLKTKTINNSLTPLWQEEKEVFDIDDSDSLEFSVWDADFGKDDDALGKVVLSRERFTTEGFNGFLQLDNAGKDIKAFLRVKVKVDGQEDYPAGPSSEFTVKFDKDPKAKAHGLDVDDTDGKYLYVHNVKDGYFKAYNDKAEPDKQLCAGDYILSVNGKKGDTKAMLEALKTQTSFDVLASRPENVCVAIERKDKQLPLGLEFGKKLTGSAVLIKKIKDGPFTVWNNANEEHKVCDGDRIVSVAGFQGKAADLQKKIQRATSCQVIVSRPAAANTSSCWC